MSSVSARSTAVSTPLARKLLLQLPVSPEPTNVTLQPTTPSQPTNPVLTSRACPPARQLPSEWNAAFEAGYAAAKGKSLITLHPPAISHMLKEVNAAADAVCEEPEQVVQILDYVITGTLPPPKDVDFVPIADRLGIACLPLHNLSGPLPPWLAWLMR